MFSAGMPGFAAPGLNSYKQLQNAGKIVTICNQLFTRCRQKRQLLISHTSTSNMPYKMNQYCISRSTPPLYKPKHHAKTKQITLAASITQHTILPYSAQALFVQPIAIRQAISRTSCPGAHTSDYFSLIVWLHYIGNYRLNRLKTAYFQFRHDCKNILENVKQKNRKNKRF